MSNRILLVLITAGRCRVLLIVSTEFVTFFKRKSACSSQKKQKQSHKCVWNVQSVDFPMDSIHQTHAPTWSDSKRFCKQSRPTCQLQSELKIRVRSGCDHQSVTNTGWQGLRVGSRNALKIITLRSQHDIGTEGWKTVSFWRNSAYFILQNLRGLCYVTHWFQTLKVLIDELIQSRNQLNLWPGLTKNTHIQFCPYMTATAVKQLSTDVSRLQK